MRHWAVLKLRVALKGIYRFCRVEGFSKIKGTLSGDPYEKGQSFSWIYLGSPYFEKLPHGVSDSGFRVPDSRSKFWSLSSPL